MQRLTCRTAELAPDAQLRSIGTRPIAALRGSTHPEPSRHGIARARNQKIDRASPLADELALRG